MGEYLRAMRQRWWVVLLGLVIGVGVGLLLQLAIPQTYSATAVVAVNPTAADVSTVADGQGSAQVNLDTEVQVSTSSEVLSKVAEEQGAEGSAEIAKHVSVSVLPNSSVLAVTYTASTPQEASDGAAAVADAYLANRREVAETTIQESVSRLQESVDQLAKQAAGSNDAAVRTRLLQTRADLQGQIAAARAASIDPGRILSAPVPPGSPDGDAFLLLAVTGVMGLVGGSLVAIALGRRRPQS